MVLLLFKMRSNRFYRKEILLDVFNQLELASTPMLIYSMR